MSNFDGPSPHPRHESFDFDSIGVGISDVERLALAEPDLFSDAKETAASPSAIEVLEVIGVFIDGEAKDA